MNLSRFLNPPCLCGPLLSLLLCVSLFSAPSTSTAAEPQSDQTSRLPNILFISIDDLNDWIGCLGGHPQVQTPNIDRLSQFGVLFNNAHCQAPICNPSRVSMHLGLLPSTTGMYFLQPNFRTVDATKDKETLFQYFRRNGYHLATRGKIFHGAADPDSFDQIEPADGFRRPKGGKKIGFTVKGGSPAWDWGAVDAKDEEIKDNRTAAWAAEQLPLLAKGEKPFFLAVGFSLPHVPLYVPQKWFDLYPRETVQLPEVLETDRDDLSQYALDLTYNSVAPRHEWMVDNHEWKHAVQAYLACISFVDDCVGTVIKGLGKSGAAGNTIVVLWSDHGFHLGEKLRWAKRTLWEETTRVPLIFTGPGIAENQECSRAVGLIDVYPTLVELAGLPPKEGLDGVSIKRLLNNPDSTWDRPAITTFGMNNHSVRTQRWRYTRYANGTQELYDHQSDPNEFTNLAKSSEYTQTIIDLRAMIPKDNAEPVPGSAGSDSPLYGEGIDRDPDKKAD